MVSAGITPFLAIVFPILSAALSHNTVADRSQLDLWLERTVSKPLVKRLGNKNAMRWATISYDFIFSLGDQQQITAIALLVATLTKLHSNHSLSVYHLRMVYSLAGVIFHGSVFAVHCWHIKLRQMPNQQEKTVRATMQGMLKSVLWLTLMTLFAYTAWVITKTVGLDAKCPASCLNHLSNNDRAASSSNAIYWLTALVGIPVWLSSCVGEILVRWAKDAYQKYEEKLSQQLHVTVYQNACRGILKAYFLFMREACGVWSGVLTLHVISALLFTMTLQNWLKKHGTVYAADLRDEKSMGFGQIVALFLLIQPVRQLLDSIFGTYFGLFFPVF